MRTALFSTRPTWRFAGGVAVAALVSSSVWSAWKDGAGGRMNALDTRKEKKLLSDISKKDKCLILAS